MIHSIHFSESTQFNDSFSYSDIRCRTEQNKNSWHKCAIDGLNTKSLSEPLVAAIKLCFDALRGWRPDRGLQPRQHAGNATNTCACSFLLLPVWLLAPAGAHAWLLLELSECNCTAANPPAGRPGTSFMQVLEKGYSRPDCPANEPSLCRSGWTRLASDGRVPVKKPIRIRGTCCPANLILPGPRLPDVSWLRGIDKRLCVIPPTVKNHSTCLPRPLPPLAPALSLSPLVLNNTLTCSNLEPWFEQRDVHLIWKAISLRACTFHPCRKAPKWFVPHGALNVAHAAKNKTMSKRIRINKSVCVNASLLMDQVSDCNA